MATDSIEKFKRQRDLLRRMADTILNFVRIKESLGRDDVVNAQIRELVEDRIKTYENWENELGVNKESDCPKKRDENIDTGCGSIYKESYDGDSDEDGDGYG